MLTILLPTIFLIGLALVAMEEQTKINKAAVAISMSIIMWSLLLFNIDQITGIIPTDVMSLFIERNALQSATLEDSTRIFMGEFMLIDKLGEVTTTLFFVMSTMVIIELLDTNGAFKFITEAIKAKKKRDLLWVIVVLAFFISAVLDNIAAAIVIIALLRKLVPDRKDRMIYACMTIIAANAGGSWSPIGDVTTILLWSSGNISALHQIAMLIIPATVAMVIPTLIATRFFGKDDVVEAGEEVIQTSSKRVKLFSKIILTMGILSLALVPVFTEVTGLPPFMGVMCGLAILWIFTDLVYGRVEIDEKRKMSVVKMFSRIDMSTIMFFFGILMSVSAMDASGLLQQAGAAVSEVISEPLLISFIVGVCSSFVDNVALVAATMGMYPLDSASYLAMDSSFWTFLAYCGVNGGSLLIIGSATGVTVMGMEKISFIYYLKKFSILALAGYISGAVCFLLINML